VLANQSASHHVKLHQFGNRAKLFFYHGTEKSTWRKTCNHWQWSCMNVMIEAAGDEQLTGPWGGRPLPTFFFFDFKFFIILILIFFLRVN
jgi:hypothetical protein